MSGSGISSLAQNIRLPFYLLIEVSFIVKNSVLGALQTCVVLNFTKLITFF